MGEHKRTSSRELLESAEWRLRQLKNFRYEILCSYIMEDRADLRKFDERLEGLTPNFSFNREEQLKLADDYYSLLQEIANEEGAHPALVSALNNLNDSPREIQMTEHYPEIDTLSCFQFYRAVLAENSPRYGNLIMLAQLVNYHSHDIADQRIARSYKINRKSATRAWEALDLVEQAMALNIYDRDLIERYVKIMRPLIDLYTIVDGETELSEGQREAFNEFRKTIEEALDEIEVFYDLYSEEV